MITRKKSKKVSRKKEKYNSYTNRFYQFKKKKRSQRISVRIHKIPAFQQIKGMYFQRPSNVMQEMLKVIQLIQK